VRCFDAKNIIIVDEVYIDSRKYLWQQQTLYHCPERFMTTINTISVPNEDFESKSLWSMI